ncbi:MAG TPA: tetratricopeptide repeat protein [Chthoniobacterales bacterium]
MKTLLRSVSAALVLASSFRPVSAEEGARAILEQLQKVASQPIPTKSPTSQAAVLLQDLQALEKAPLSGTPLEQARKWVDLLDRYIAALRDRSAPSSLGSNGFRRLLLVIPPPESWDAVADLIGKDTALPPQTKAYASALAATLQNREQDLLDLAKSSSGYTEASPTDQQDDQGIGTAIYPFLASHSTNPQIVMTALESQFVSTPQSFWRDELTIPALVPLIGENAVVEFFKKALAKPMRLTVDDRATRMLAVKTAVTQAEKLKAAQWGLIQDTAPESMKLYEILAKKFPGKAGNNDESARKSARSYYLVSLIAEDKIDAAKQEAVNAAKMENFNLPNDAIASLIESGHGEKVYKFLRDITTSHPDLPYWNSFTYVASELHHESEMLVLARKAADRPNLDPKQSAEVLSVLRSAALAADQVDEGIALLRREFEVAKATPDGHSRLGNLATDLIALGKVLKRPELADEGISLLKPLPADQADPWNKNILRAELDAGKTDAAQQRIVTKLKEIVPKLASSRMVRPDSWDETERSAERADEYLANLCGFFWETGRPAEVKILLDENPWWSGGDLASLKNQPCDFRERPLDLIAAKSFAALGDKEAALRILENYLIKRRSDDQAYALFTELKGLAADPFLDKLAQDDPFEERPLIWKASVLLDANDLDAAEETIRRAIAIDPSDGEMGRGDRMRAYAVLADTLEKSGNTDQATIFSGAVKAIRVSEDADDFRRAGLLSRAVKMYEEALTYFADAYCIQSRLAIQLAQLGRMEEGAIHYQRAYELMPDSFGRMESHCFGCERAFKGKTAETLAERTFKKILEKTPDKPQAHYLLGYLRMEQGRPADAATGFRKAAELDPDYINAWAKLVSVADAAGLSSAERDHAILEVYRLDPRGKHAFTQIDNVSDIRGLWAAADAASKKPWLRPGDQIYKLAAVKPPAAPNDEDSDSGRHTTFYWLRRTSDAPRTPAELLAAHNFIVSLMQQMTFSAQR